MKLANDTPFPARLFRGGIDERRLFGSVAVRVTYDIVGDRLRVAREQAWPISPGPWDSPYGPLPGDDLFYRGGVDLLVFGSARAARPVPRIDIDLRVGDRFRGRLVVFGDRVWRRERGRLVPGPPEPFRELPLTLAYSFGGTFKWDGLDVAYPDNPVGRGYYPDERAAEGNLLPNIEDPNALCARWDDRPEPVGTGAPGITFGPRLRRSLEFDPETGDLKVLRPTFFNAAFPQLIVPAARPGDRVSITGVRRDGPLVFHLPETDLRVRLAFGDETAEKTPAIDQIGVEPDLLRVFISYRYPFRYVLNPHQRRSCELVQVRGRA
ncbi:MAG TPA: DUF2169 domain-containing protein [Nannocystis sp.]